MSDVRYTIRTIFHRGLNNTALIRSVKQPTFWAESIGQSFNLLVAVSIQYVHYEIVQQQGPVNWPKFRHGEPKII
jgi:hypothetical protein